MKDILRGKFYNPTCGSLSYREVVKEIIEWMRLKPQASYEVIVGCDSSSSEEPHFPLAVVLLRKGEGGRFFLKRIKYKNRKFFNWHQRILEEVLLSCDLALSLKEILDPEVKKISEIKNYQFKYIHADIGEEGVTKDMIKEVTGLIRGNGFEPKIKPEAYVASIVADRFS
ncbi:hypothetical protein J7K24_01205 [bacterium]|nr:hypothetical protein [bacterium]